MEQLSPKYNNQISTGIFGVFLGIQTNFVGILIFKQQYLRLLAICTIKIPITLYSSYLKVYG